jgi:hypothetical protein
MYKQSLSNEKVCFKKNPRIMRRAFFGFVSYIDETLIPASDCFVE